MNSVWESISNDIIHLAEQAPLLIYALLTLLIFVLIGRLVSLLVKKGLEKGEFSTAYQSFFIKITRWVFYLFGFVFALNTLGFHTLSNSILAGSGVTAVVLGFAFRDIGENILAGFFLAFSRPFSIGDLIRSEGLEGRVRNVELRHTHIRTAEGCDIFIPSAQIFSKPLHNFTRDGLRRAGFVIGLDYEDNIEKALISLRKALDETHSILRKPAHTVSILNFTSNYVELQINFWINASDQEGTLSKTRTEIMEKCREKLLQEGFTFSSSVTTALEMDRIRVALEKDKDQ